MAHPNPITLSLCAMATRFELVLHGEDPAHLRAAGEEALDEIARLDAQLSLYRRDSELSWINAHAARAPVRVERRLFRLLQRAAELSRATGGAFDVTVAPLMRAWGFVGSEGRIPSPAELRSAKDISGMKHVRLDEEEFTVSFEREGIEMDLGAIGKGCAIERALESLRENGINSALLHGGTSTIHGVGSPPESDAWRVAIRDPSGRGQEEPGPGNCLDTVELRDGSLSVSASHGKSFRQGSVEYGHVIDPRTGEPGRSALLSAVMGPSPTDSDALSTALLLLGELWLPVLAREFPGYRGIVATAPRDGLEARVCGG